MKERIHLRIQTDTKIVTDVTVALVNCLGLSQCSDDLLLIKENKVYTYAQAYNTPTCMYAQMQAHIQGTVLAGILALCLLVICDFVPLDFLFSCFLVHFKSVC